MTKTLAHDVLPDLRATNGWTQEKLEGLTVGGDGTVWAITDNDGLADATGETVLLSLGAASDVFDGHLDEETPGGPGEPGETPGAGSCRRRHPGTPWGGRPHRGEPRRSQPLPTRVRAGERVTATADGFAPGEWVSATLFSTPADLGMVRADASGRLTATVTVPADTAVGEHRFALVGQVDGRVLWTELEVLATDAATGGSDGAAPTRPDGLATTGSHVGALVGLAIVLVAGGVTIVVARRRLRGLPRWEPVRCPVRQRDGSVAVVRHEGPQDQVRDDLGPGSRIETAATMRTTVGSQPNRRAIPAHTPAIIRPWRGRDSVGRYGAAEASEVLIPRR